MPNAIIKIGDREIPVGTSCVTLGRAPDNTAAFENDSNVSRYHAEIERRGDDFWLVDLGSSNGTELNGIPVVGDCIVRDGDTILLGGSSAVTFTIVPEAAKAPTEPQPPSVPADAPDVPTPAMPDAVSNSHAGLILACAACGLVLVAVIVVGAIYLLSGSSCDAKATVVKPEPGDTISAATEIELDVENSNCVTRAVFTIDGIEFAEASELPFSATIDPAEFPELADGYDHSMEVALEDESGARISGTEPIVLAFESRAVSKGDAPRSPGAPAPSAGSQPAAPKSGQPSLIELNDMAKRIVKLFPASASHNISNKQFLQEVQKRTAEYAQEGYYARAAKYRDAINVAFVREQNLDAPLGFYLAMSRSKFSPDKQGSDEGMWRMNAATAAASGYTGLCGTETLSDASQNCAAKAASLYMKSLVLGVFDGDVIYAVAVFGKSPQEAGVWKSSLGPNRNDVWTAVKGAPEREQLVRFFAAAIVAENPQKFGLKADRPLSELYRLAM